MLFLCAMFGGEGQREHVAGRGLGNVRGKSYMSTAPLGPHGDIAIAHILYLT